MSGSATAIAHKNSSFVQVISVNPLCLKAKFSQTSNGYKIILEAVEFTYANKTKSLLLPRSYALTVNCEALLVF